MAVKEISNRQAYFNYFIEDKYTAGIVLKGTEIKSLREGKASFNDSFCYFHNNELWVKSLYIAEYAHGTVNNHLPVYDRKLLLTKRELKKILSKTKEAGVTIIPLKIFFNEKNLAKMEIGIAKGKKLYDKRETLKKRDSEKQIKRFLK